MLGMSLCLLNPNTKCDVHTPIDVSCNRHILTALFLHPSLRSSVLTAFTAQQCVTNSRADELRFVSIICRKTELLQLAIISLNVTQPHTAPSNCYSQT